MKVKIVGIPAGTAPESIREALNGLEMESAGFSTCEGSKEDHTPDYCFKAAVVLQALRESKKTLAYNYWGRKLVKDSTLIIQADCCREI